MAEALREVRVVAEGIRDAREVMDRRGAPNDSRDELVFESIDVEVEGFFSSVEAVAVLAAAGAAGVANLSVLLRAVGAAGVCATVPGAILLLLGTAVEEVDGREGVLGGSALRPAVEVEPVLAPKLTAPPMLARVEVLEGGVMEEPEEPSFPVRLTLLELVFKLGILLVTAAAGAAPVSRSMLDLFSLNKLNFSRVLAEAEDASASNFTCARFTNNPCNGSHSK